jgi:3-dehydroquinate dehydratase / shikimate dehydrogenase
MPGTQVVETVSARSLAELRAARDHASADLVELRLDALDAIDVAGALADRRLPVIVTCRASWEGGLFQGSEEDRLRVLQDAIRQGAEYVDIEWRADRGRLRLNDRTRVVLSHHDFSATPADLADRVAAMRAERPAVVKVAVTPARLGDCLRLREVMTIDVAHVAIAMGPLGRVTRLCPWLFGSEWTYGGTIAPGQVSARELIDLYRVRGGSATTAIYAVTGAPLAHSASPAMHNAAFRAVGLDAVYVPLETADGEELLAVADALGVRGVSVTAPLKPAMFERAVEVDDLSSRIGAVNTLRRRHDGWEARNFDASGFLAPLERRRVNLRGMRAVVLGAGGSARTVAWALDRAGARVEVAARQPSRGQALAAELGARAIEWPPSPGWDLLVNTTPVGTWPATEAAPIERPLVRGGIVYDLIYNPSETTLLGWARAAGAETIGGLEMLVGQACHQFTWWTDHAAPAAVMEQAAEAFITQSRSRTS